MNTPRVRLGTSGRTRRRAAEYDCYPVRSLSFVSALIDVEAIRSVGLPVAGYFLWNDDFEFTTRLLKDRPGYVCGRSVVIHKTKTYGSTDTNPGQRFVLEVRNKFWMLRFSSSLRPFEKVMYGAATLVRWSRTVLRSTDRAETWRHLLQGFRDGVRSAPPSNEAVFADSSEIAAGLQGFGGTERSGRS
jgi:GT2 family glycosyltransferase